MKIQQPYFLSKDNKHKSFDIYSICCFRRYQMSLEQIYRNVEASLKIQLTVDQRRKIYVAVDNLSKPENKAMTQQLLAGKPKAEVIDILSLFFTEILSEEIASIDIKSQLHNQMLAEKPIVRTNTIYKSKLTTDLIKNIYNIYHPEESLEYAMVYLEREYNDGDDSTYFHWYVLGSKDEQIFGTTVSSSLLPIKNVKTIQMLPFEMPRDRTQQNTGTTFSVSVAIDEFKNFAYYSSSIDKQFHFITSASVMTGNRKIRLENLCSTGDIFTFNKPLRVIENLTIRFGTPFQPMQFTTMIYKGDDATQVTGATTEFQFVKGVHNDDATRVYITGYTTAAPVTDAATIAIMNQSSGHAILATVATTVSYTFEIAVNTTTITAGSLNGAKFILRERNFIMPLRIGYM